MLKELRIQRTSHLVNENSDYGARLLNAMLTVNHSAGQIVVVWARRFACSLSGMMVESVDVLAWSVHLC